MATNITTKSKVTAESTTEPAEDSGILSLDDLLQLEESAAAAWKVKRATKSGKKTSAGKDAPIIRPAGSVEACDAIRAYDLSPLSIADGHVYQIGGKREGWKERTPRDNAMNFAMELLHRGFSKGDVGVDTLYRLIIRIIETGFPGEALPPIGGDIPETLQPLKYLNRYCARFNTGLLVRPDDTIRQSDFPASNKPGRNPFVRDLSV